MTVISAAESSLRRISAAVTPAMPLPIIRNFIAHLLKDKRQGRNKIGRVFAAVFLENGCLWLCQSSCDGWEPGTRQECHSMSLHHIKGDSLLWPHGFLYQDEKCG